MPSSTLTEGSTPVRTDEGRAQGCLDSQASAGAIANRKENQSRQCNFAGRRWDGDYFAHFNWCLGVGPQTAARETGIRLAALKNDCMMKVYRTEEKASPLPPFISSTTTCKLVPKPAH